jgi:hypothetical protein
MTPLETLKAARQLITDPAKWTQGEAARDHNGKGVLAYGEDAVCFCALGAIRNVVGMDDDAFDLVFDTFRDKAKVKLVACFNDTHTHAEVLALFDAAIAELEGV